MRKGRPKAALRPHEVWSASATSVPGPKSPRQGYRLPAPAHEPRRPAFPCSQKVACFAYAHALRFGTHTAFPWNTQVSDVTPSGVGLVVRSESISVDRQRRGAKQNCGSVMRSYTIICQRNTKVCQVADSAQASDGFTVQTVYASATRVLVGGSK